MREITKRCCCSLETTPNKDNVCSVRSHKCCCGCPHEPLTNYVFRISEISNWNVFSTASLRPQKVERVGKRSSPLLHWAKLAWKTTNNSRNTIVGGNEWNVWGPLEKLAEGCERVSMHLLGLAQQKTILNTIKKALDCRKPKKNLATRFNTRLMLFYHSLSWLRFEVFESTKMNVLDDFFHFGELSVCSREE